MTATRGWAMDKKMCIGSLAVAAIMLVLFLVDVIAGFPFGGGGFIAIDIIGLLASGILIYLSIAALRELR